MNAAPPAMTPPESPSVRRPRSTAAARWKRWWPLLPAMVVAAAVGVYLVERYAEDGVVPGGAGMSAGAVGVPDPAQQLRTGAMLARAANCMACHSARGEAPFAGGRVINTPFGNFITPNITSDPVHGIGAWSADDFWRALHEGKSPERRFYYPAFPFTSYTRMTRADSDALYAWMRTVPPSARANQSHALQFPYDQRILLAGWRALYFRAGTYVARPERSVQWNRGAYLVEGVGHCSACHAARNALGATRAGPGLGGALIASQDWYAPSLAAADEAGVADWARRDVVDLLQTGVSMRSSVFGPMAEVVAQSLQYLETTDIDAMATYLQQLPGQETTKNASGAAKVSAPAATAAGGNLVTPDATVPRDATAQHDDQALRDPQLVRGAALYRNHCIDCHGADGRGAPPAYPPLAGNRALLMSSAVNPIRMVLHGGFAPATAGNPRPFGMPPFGPVLDDAQIADLVSYLRASWGNRSPAVSREEVGRYRAVPVD